MLVVQKVVEIFCNWFVFVGSLKFGTYESTPKILQSTLDISSIDIPKYSQL